MEIIELTAQNITEGFNDIIDNKKQCFVYGIPDKTYVFKGTDDMCDCNYCINNNIEILSIPNGGGAIVLNSGDVEIGIFKDNGWNIINDFMDALCEKLKQKILNVKVVGNDLIIDEKYKCCGSSSRNLGDAKNPYIYTAIHISLAVNLDLIGYICKKEMVKIPKGLKDWGISTPDVLKMVFEIINQINYKFI